MGWTKTPRICPVYAAFTFPAVGFHDPRALGGCVLLFHFVVFSTLISPLCFSLFNFHWPVFKFTNSFLYCFETMGELAMGFSSKNQLSRNGQGCSCEWLTIRKNFLWWRMWSPGREGWRNLIPSTAYVASCGEGVRLQSCQVFPNTSIASTVV